MQQQERQYKKYGKIAAFLRGNLSFLVLAAAAGMMTSLCNALIPQVIRYTVDHLISGEGTETGGFVLTAAAAAVLVCAVCSGLFTYLSNVSMAKGSEGFLKSMRDRLYSHIQKLPYVWHGQNKTGDIIQRCTNDVEIIRTFVCTQLQEVIRIVFLIVLYLSIMFAMNRKLCLPAALFLPAIFVLDEATSSIDTETEQLIQKATEKLLRGRTSFVIAHRLSTIRHADLILVVRDGKIVEQGTHEELLRQGAYYASLISQK